MLSEPYCLEGGCSSFTYKSVASAGRHCVLLHFLKSAGGISTCHVHGLHKMNTVGCHHTQAHTYAQKNAHSYFLLSLSLSLSPSLSLSLPHTHTHTYIHTYITHTYRLLHGCWRIAEARGRGSSHHLVRRRWQVCVCVCELYACVVCIVYVHIWCAVCVCMVCFVYVHIWCVVCVCVCLCVYVCATRWLCRSQQHLVNFFWQRSYTGPNPASTPRTCGQQTATSLHMSI